MVTTQEEFAGLLAAPEGTRLEFKAARGSFHFEELVKYVVALANEGGGSIVLGVEDSRPRRVVGSAAFPEPGRTEAGLYEQLHQRIPVEEHLCDGKRVLVVHAPPRLSGTAWQYKGSFWMRAGDALVPMTDEQLRRIHGEAGPDFSAEPCANAGLGDLDSGAITVLRRLWDRKSPGQGILVRSVDRLLADAELVVEGRLTYAALILLGTREALGRHLSQSEIVFEYRPSDAPLPDVLRPRVGRLVEEGIIERVGRGRGTRLLLSRHFYRHLGRPGVYTRKRGLDRETNKALLVRHLQESGISGSPMSELQQVLPAVARAQLKRLLAELRQEGRILLVGRRRGARWHSASSEGMP